MKEQEVKAKDEKGVIAHSSDAQERIAPGQEQPKPKNTNAGKQRIAACVLALCACFLIVFSACNLFVPAGQGNTSNMLATTAKSTDDTNQNTNNAQNTSSQDINSEGDSSSASSAANASAQSEQNQASTGRDTNNSSTSANSKSSSASGASSNSSTDANTHTNTQSSENSTSHSSNSESDSDSTQENTIDISICVSSDAVNSSVSVNKQLTLPKGSTAYDALCATGVSVNAEQTSYGTYVSAIGGLAQKEYGASSGWMYSVNGTVPMTSCSNYVLSAGDVLEWYYVV